MIQYLERNNINRSLCLVILALGAVALSLGSGRRAALADWSAIIPSTEQSPLAAVGTPNGDDSRDARTRSTELMALAAFGDRVGSGGNGRALASAIDVLRAWQWNEERGCSTSHPYFGGTGQWGASAPDLTHTSLSIQALRSVGVESSDPAIKRAAVFISRCQFIEDFDRRRDGDRQDLGGFAAGLVIDRTRGTAVVPLGRPTGATTCMGVPSLPLAGVAPDDSRVRRALRWLELHYDLNAHPGMANAREGLYGFYYEFTEAMTALRLDRIGNCQGVLHDWRSELKQRLAAMQHADGSWTNPDESNDPTAHSTATITSLALLTICQLTYVAQVLANFTPKRVRDRPICRFFVVETAS
jgi:squalene-hopene/tetraprenyl-beta-curcumene cyclase